MAYAVHGTTIVFSSAELDEIFQNGRGVLVFSTGWCEGREGLRTRGGARKASPGNGQPMSPFFLKTAAQRALLKSFFVAGGVFCLTSLVLLVAGASPWPAFIISFWVLLDHGAS